MFQVSKVPLNKWVNEGMTKEPARSQSISSWQTQTAQGSQQLLQAGPFRCASHEERGATGLSTSGNHSLFRLWFLAFTTVNLKTILGFNYFKKWKFPVKKLQCTNITLKYIATIGKSIYSYILTNTKKCLNEYHILKNHTLSTLPRRASLTLPPSYPSYRTSGSGRQQLHICP